jgi:starvation-inducible outer membrane lipoprotein
MNMRKIIFVLLFTMMLSACASPAINREYGKEFDPYRYMNGTNK